MAYRHYIITDAQNRVTDGWSSGEKPGIGPAQGCVLLTDAGEEHFPFAPLKNEDGLARYKYEGGAVVLRSQEELDADRPEPIEPEPSELERLRADVDYIMIMEGLA